MPMGCLHCGLGCAVHASKPAHLSEHLHTQKCEEDAERLPNEIEAHQARATQLTEELAGAEAEVERLAEAARPEREALTRKQQVGAQPYTLASDRQRA